ncbi:L-galactose dehydrogenase (L-GalDH) [Paracoccidioides lutzii Pb01]|uniref:L-galactose dehydrogenase (L-GalDH) n=1 Tax=Paracoccidioides lutzii (strain ATCC MYA-826 / Pb01) TaxID=502779 RepID=C1GSA1_PARBA|nr:L-galactose dehydrogenase (L-GalDH) [Paracoccidioides lutzii Pb01]EEH38934.1 L-galactose dehydrogenase (L-GalDH) [Paracoccidioides lutzii Pb01]
MGKPSIPLSSDLPPLICGTATFNSQYNADPYVLPTTAIVQRALSAGIRAFDTSPYYGPAEELLGRALSTDFVRIQFPRYSYRLLTKVGRIAAQSFDYSPAWIRKSIKRSLSRLQTAYLDVVYCHDVEFVSPDEVLGAVVELRRIRDMEGTIRYVGISGYPVDVLCSLAEMILQRTGEPLDAVMSYANFTLQNTKLAVEGLPRLLAAGVDVVPNASPLGMGLLRRDGVPIGGMGDFHPAPVGLRNSIRSASEWTERQGEKIEVVAIRYALESWLREGSAAGALGPPLAPSADADPGFISAAMLGVGRRLGVSVVGVSSLDELNETLRVWHSIVDGLENEGEDSLSLDGDSEEYFQRGTSETVENVNVPISKDTSMPPSVLTPCYGITDRQWSRARRQRIIKLAKGIREILGPEWVDYTWASPEEGFLNTLPENHNTDELDGGVLFSTPTGEHDDVGNKSARMLTPPMEPINK